MQKRGEKIMKTPKKYYWADTGLRSYCPPRNKKFATVKGAWNHIIRKFQDKYGHDGQRIVMLYTDTDVRWIHGKRQFPTICYGHENYEPLGCSVAVCAGISHLDYNGRKWKVKND